MAKTKARQAQANKQKHWVDSVFNTLSPRQRLGQLFMVAAYSNKNEQHYKQIDQLISQYGVGGLIFFQGGPQRQANLTNRYQNLSSVPLMIGMDAEWGLAMRLDSTVRFPAQMTLGALSDANSIYRMGLEIAAHCKRMGVHVNFAPVADINSNPKNPVIGYRSFGEDKQRVAARSMLYARGLQHGGVMACGKHFPGHGDAEADSHYDLPVIRRTKSQFENLELYPFKRLIQDSIASIMIAHLHLPAYDKTPNRPSTLSPDIVNGLLRKKLNFNGLIFTDAMNMKGMSAHHKAGEADVLALAAGNDILLFPQDVSIAIEAIEKAIVSRRLDQKDINQKVIRILEAKYKVGLRSKPIISLTNLYKDLHTRNSELLLQEMYQKAITLARNKGAIVPIRNLENRRFVSISIGAEENNRFGQMLNKYAPFRHYHLPLKSQKIDFDTLLSNFKGRRTVIISLHGLNNSPAKNFGINDSVKSFIAKMQKKHEVIVVVFGNAYSLGNFETSDVLLCAYEDNWYTRTAVPQALFGAALINGSLPVSVSPTLKAGQGQTSVLLNRLRYGEPELVQMSFDILAKIDSIASKIIKENITPGCQIMVAKDGIVVYDKCFGFLSYDKQDSVGSGTLYDLASITKVASTLQAIMFLQERGRLDVYQKASFYLPELIGTDKENIVVASLLTHQAGLQAFIPFWKKMVRNDNMMDTWFCSQSDGWFSLEISPGIYTMRAMDDSIWKWTRESPLLKPNKNGGYDYKYSDLSFMFVKRIAEKLLNQPINEFMEQNFYQPLGLGTMCFNPLNRFGVRMIAPTENDKLFRGTLVHGSVHDPIAALTGGIAGHAGLFSSANDLMKLMQMNLQQGNYGGLKYFMQPTLGLFTKRPFATNRRGLGWDKPLKQGGGPVSKSASQSTFGHTGFTGTAAWADPENKLVFVFLSNRVHPDAENVKLIEQNIRPKIQDMVYKSILSTYPTAPAFIIDTLRVN